MPLVGSNRIAPTCKGERGGGLTNVTGGVGGKTNVRVAEGL